MFNFMVFSAAIMTSTGQERIFGGNNTRIQDFPFVALLVSIDVKHLVECTGGIISINWVVSASHCVKSELLIFAGFDNYLNFIDDLHNGKLQYRISEEVHTHPNFAPDDLAHDDIALIKVNAPFSISKAVSPVKLSLRPWNELSNRKCKAIGWGRNKDEFSYRLQSIDVEIQHGRDSCQCLRSHLKDNVFCLGSSESKSICKGDSGGVILCQGEAFGIAHAIYESNWCKLTAFDYRHDGQDLMCSEVGVSAVYMFLCPYFRWMESVFDNATKKTVLPFIPSDCNGGHERKPNVIKLVASEVISALTLFWGPHNFV